MICQPSKKNMSGENNMEASTMKKAPAKKKKKNKLKDNEIKVLHSTVYSLHCKVSQEVSTDSHIPAPSCDIF